MTARFLSVVLRRIRGMRSDTREEISAAPRRLGAAAAGVLHEFHLDVPRELGAPASSWPAQVPRWRDRRSQGIPRCGCTPKLVGRSARPLISPGPVAAAARGGRCWCTPRVPPRRSKGAWGASQQLAGPTRRGGRRVGRGVASHPRPGSFIAPMSDPGRLGALDPGGHRAAGTRRRRVWSVAAVGVQVRNAAPGPAPPGVAVAASAEVWRHIPVLGVSSRQCPTRGGSARGALGVNGGVGGAGGHGGDPGVGGAGGQGGSRLRWPPRARTAARALAVTAEPAGTAGLLATAVTAPRRARCQRWCRWRRWPRR